MKRLLIAFRDTLFIWFIVGFIIGSLLISAAMLGNPVGLLIWLIMITFLVSYWAGKDL